MVYAYTTTTGVVLVGFVYTHLVPGYLPPTHAVVRGCTVCGCGYVLRGLPRGLVAPLLPRTVLRLRSARFTARGLFAFIPFRLPFHFAFCRFILYPVTLHPHSLYSYWFACPVLYCRSTLVDVLHVYLLCRFTVYLFARLPPAFAVWFGSRYHTAFAVPGLPVLTFIRVTYRLPVVTLRLRLRSPACRYAVTVPHTARFTTWVTVTTAPYHGAFAFVYAGYWLRTFWFAYLRALYYACAVTVSGYRFVTFTVTRLPVGLRFARVVAHTLRVLVRTVVAPYRWVATVVRRLPTRGYAHALHAVLRLPTRFTHTRSSVTRLHRYLCLFYRFVRFTHTVHTCTVTGYVLPVGYRFAAPPFAVCGYHVLPRWFGAAGSTVAHFTPFPVTAIRFCRTAAVPPDYWLGSVTVYYTITTHCRCCAHARTRGLPPAFGSAFAYVPVHTVRFTCLPAHLHYTLVRCGYGSILPGCGWLTHTACRDFTVLFCGYCALVTAAFSVYTHGCGSVRYLPAAHIYRLPAYLPHTRVHLVGSVRTRVAVTRFARTGCLRLPHVYCRIAVMPVLVCPVYVVHARLRYVGGYRAVTFVHVILLRGYTVLDYSCGYTRLRLLVGYHGYVRGCGYHVAFYIPFCTVTVTGSFVIRSRFTHVRTRYTHHALQHHYLVLVRSAGYAGLRCLCTVAAACSRATCGWLDAHTYTVGCTFTLRSHRALPVHTAFGWFGLPVYTFTAAAFTRVYVCWLPPFYMRLRLLRVGFCGFYLPFCYGLPGRSVVLPRLRYTFGCGYHTGSRPHHLYRSWIPFCVYVRLFTYGCCGCPCVRSLLRGCRSRGWILLPLCHLPSPHGLRSAACTFYYGFGYALLRHTRLPHVLRLYARSTLLRFCHVVAFYIAHRFVATGYLHRGCGLHSSIPPRSRFCGYVAIPHHHAVLRCHHGLPVTCRLVTHYAVLPAVTLRLPPPVTPHVRSGLIHYTPYTLRCHHARLRLDPSPVVVHIWFCHFCGSGSLRTHTAFLPFHGYMPHATYVPVTRSRVYRTHTGCGWFIPHLYTVGCLPLVTRLPPCGSYSSPYSYPVLTFAVRGCDFTCHGCYLYRCRPPHSGSVLRFYAAFWFAVLTLLHYVAPHTRIRHTVYVYAVRWFRSTHVCYVHRLRLYPLLPHIPVLHTLLRLHHIWLPGSRTHCATTRFWLLRLPGCIYTAFPVYTRFLRFATTHAVWLPGLPVLRWFVHGLYPLYHRLRFHLYCGYTHLRLVLLHVLRAHYARCGLRLRSRLPALPHV